MPSPRLFGWTPSRPEGDVVDIPPQASSSCQFTFDWKVDPVDSAQISSPPPSQGILNTTAVGKEKIPRPQNSFFIFRTEFSRLYRNSRDKKSRREDIKTTGLPFSRMAGEAWRMLPPEEKRRYHHLAELAKEQHARDYPNYQYRPKRSERAARRTIPSPTLTISTVRDTSDCVTLCSPAEQPPSSPEAELPPKVDPAVKADRRRSSSVPVTWGEHLYTATLWPDELGRERWERPEKWERPGQAKRRSRSVTEDWARLAPSFQAHEPTFDPRSPQDALFTESLYPQFRVQSPHAHHDTLNPAALFTPAQHMSPLMAVASSLAGWNGAVPSSSTSAPAPPVAPQPVRLNRPPWLVSPETVLEYEPASNSEFDAEGISPMMQFAGDQWPLEPAVQYVFGGPVHGTVHGHEKSASTPEDYARMAALQEYELGLQERVHGADFGFFGDFDPAAELQF